MIQANQQAVQTVVEEVLAQLGNRGTTTTSVGASPDGDWGVFSKVDDAVDAATRAFRQLQDKTIEDRARAIACVVRICSTQCDELGRAELEETRIGRLDHKIEKLQIVKLVPGTEFLRCDALSGDRGLTVIE
ncbi:MAG: aldehyde dehydrogenase EutE, partial [Planctomycetota bacterium]|nr:aldehyde dehydrogenase EutE [Planctomycetota bacterium]